MGSKKRVVLSFVGYQGSGKTTIAGKLARHLNTTHLEVSDVVKDISGIRDRASLPKTRKRTEKDPFWLGKAVFERIDASFKDNGNQSAVISGVREQEIHDYLAKRNLTILAIELTSTPIERFTRLYSLGKIESPQEFIEHDLKEKQMGLDQVIGFAPYMIETSENTAPDALVNALVQRIIKEGFEIKKYEL